MKFEEILIEAMAMLQRQGRVSYRALQLQFQLDDDYLDVLKEEIIDVHQVAADHHGKMLVWTGEPPAPVPTAHHETDTEIVYIESFLASVPGDPALNASRVARIS